MSHAKALFFILASIVLLFLPVLIWDFGIIAQNPEQYLTGTAKEVFGYFSRDPTGSVIELAYAGFSKKQILNGQLPLWSPFQGLGHPFLADIPSSGLFAPINLLRLLLPAKYWSFIFIVNLVLGCWFVYLLCRAYDLTPEAAIPAGISFAAIGTTALYLSVSSITLVVTWLPLLLCGVEHTLIGSRSRSTWLAIILGSYGVATGGHPTITLLGGIFVITYICIRYCQLQAPMRPLLRLTAAAIIALLITAVQWLPFVSYVAYRGNTFSDFSDQRFDFKHVPAYFLPYVYGQLNTNQTNTQPSVPLGDYWSLGWAPPGLLVLVIMGLFHVLGRKQIRSGPMALLGPALLFVLWAFGIPPFQLVSELPFFNRIRPHYLSVAIGFTTCVLVGVGLDALIAREIKWRYPLFVAGGLCLITGVWALQVLRGARVDLAMGAHFILPAWSYGTAWIAAATGALWLLSRRGDRYKDLSRRLSLVTVLACMLSAVAFFPWASPLGIEHARFSTLICFMAAAPAFLVAHLRRTTMLAVVIAATVMSRLYVASAPQHLPRKQDLFAEPAYARVLNQRMAPEYRAYGMEGFLFPNFSSAFNRSVINVLTGMVSQQVDRFYRTFLDETQAPEQFLGLAQNSVAGGSTPARELWKHKKFWDYIGARYIVTNASVNDAVIQPDGSGGSATFPGGLRPEALVQPVRLQFKCPVDTVKTTCIFLGTYNQVNHGKVTLSLVGENTSVTNTAEVDSSGVKDLACTRFEFPLQICPTTNEPVELELKYDRTDDRSALAVFKGLNDEVQYRLLSPRKEKLVHLFEDPVSRGHVWENTGAQPRAYIAPESAPAASWQEAQDAFAEQNDLRRRVYVDDQQPCASNSDLPADSAASRIHRMHVESDRIVVDIDAFSPGTFVLVDAFTPGWKAYVDGRPQSVSRVNGAFRGTCIESVGMHRVIMEYDPQHWRIAKVLASLGLAGFVVLIWTSKRRLRSE